MLPMPMQQTPAEGATVSVAAGEHCSALAMKQAIAISAPLIAVCCHLNIQSNEQLQSVHTASLRKKAHLLNLRTGDCG